MLMINEELLRLCNRLYSFLNDRVFLGMDLSVDELDEIRHFLDDVKPEIWAANGALDDMDDSNDTATYVNDTGL